MQIIYKPIKNIYLRIDKDGELKITAPRRASLHQIQKLVEERQAWIEKAQNKHRNQSLNSQNQVKIDLNQAKIELTKRIRELAKGHNLPFNKLGFRSQKTRFGSCSSQKNISLNYQLFNMPQDFVDYVLMHELVHTRYMNHGQDFWNLLELICPGAKNFHRQRRDHVLK